MNAITTSEDIMVGDLDIDIIWSAIVSVVADMVREECAAQHASQTVFDETLKSCLALGDYLADAREELGSGVTLGELIGDTLSRSRMFADDVLARTVAGLIRFLRARDTDSGATVRFLSHHGDDAYKSPATVYAQFAHLPQAAARYLLMLTWTHGQPTKLPQKKWRSLFDRAGFTADGRNVDRPDTVPTLYRAALPGHEKNWSWTDSLAVARWFQERVAGSDIYVLEGGVAADAVLARYDNLGENEWVVDVAASGATPTRLAA